MSRRTLPSIPPSALRDGADPEVVDRVWARLERELPTARTTRTETRGRLAWAAVAAAAAFAVGAGVGSSVSTRSREPALTSSTPALEPAAPVSVFAAGRAARSFALPGGGSVTLAPGSLVEVGVETASGVKLDLLQGQASFDTATRPSGSVLVAVADAVLAAPTNAKLRVTRAGEAMSVLVTTGSADVTLADGGRHVLREGETERSFAILAPVATMPAPTAKVAHQAHHAEGPVTADAGVTEPPVAVVAAPTWLDLATGKSPDYAKAAKLLADQPGGVDAAIKGAQSAHELSALRTVIGGGIDARVLRILTRIVDDFPSDARAGLAAGELAKHYADKDPVLAKKYREFQSQSKVSEVAGAGLCQSMKSELTTGNKTRAAELAKEYATKYPDGPCKDDAKRIAAGKGDDEDEEPEEAEPEPAPAATDDAKKKPN